MRTKIKFSANWDSREIIIKCPSRYNEKYVRKVLRDRLKKVFLHQNFELWLNKSLNDADKYYTFELLKPIDFSGIPLTPLNKAALNHG